MSSRAFLNSFMLCPRLRAKSGNFFAPKRTRTMRRIINRSGPPRFPIPNASIFITILNWLNLMFYSSRSAYIYVLRCRDRCPTTWTPCREPDKIRIALGKVFHCLRPAVPPDKEASLAVDAIAKCDLLRFRGRDAMRALLVGGVKTAAFPDLQKLSGPPHSHRRQPRTRIPHDPNARHYSRL